MSNFIDQASTLAELHDGLLRAMRSLRGSRKELPAIADAAGEIVADTYEFAGADSAECTTRGNKIQRALLDLAGDLDRMVETLAAARRIVVQASADASEADAKRKAQAAKYRV
jgi:parvulin-like peptidyl-prolyl isomerase